MLAATIQPPTRCPGCMLARIFFLARLWTEDTLEVHHKSVKTDRGHDPPRS